MLGESLPGRFEALGPHLTPRQRRLWLAVEARELGPGGARAVARAVGVDAEAVRRGMAELDEPPVLPGPTPRRPGAGRKRSEVRNPELAAALDSLIDPDPGTDAGPPLRWTCRSTRDLAAALGERGHRVSDFVVRRLLKESGYRLHGNARSGSGHRPVDRATQFAYVNEQVRAHQAAACPVVCVDAVRLAAGSGTGRVELAPDADTAAFAVAVVRQWWQAAGQARYPSSDRLLVTAYVGGSIGYRGRLWNHELAALAAETGRRITVCLLPPGTSRWTVVERRLHAQMSMESGTRPPITHQIAVSVIGAGTGAGSDPPTPDAPASSRRGSGTEPPGPAAHARYSEWNYVLPPGVRRRTRGG